VFAGGPEVMPENEHRRQPEFLQLAREERGCEFATGADNASHRSMHTFDLWQQLLEARHAETLPAKLERTSEQVGERHDKPIERGDDLRAETVR
jgi:hypothetical protein